MPQESAVVIATYSRRMRLRLASGHEVDARIKGKRLKPVCGDAVSVRPIPGETERLITSIRDRDNELTRPNLRGETDVLAANVEQLVVVAAATPDPDWYIVDRYLCAAENMNIPAVVVYNKSDLHRTGGDVENALAEYERLGYAAVCVSAKTGDNFAELEALLVGKIAIVVGQSGVGKSTIINRLTGARRQKTAAVSEKRGEGRHTTVNSVMLSLPGGGAVIDSPGVRDYAPALQSSMEVVRGFPEIGAAGSRCRFANCRHLREPGCAVKEAVADAAIDTRRYESYRRLLAITEKRG